MGGGGREGTLILTRSIREVIVTAILITAISTVVHKVTDLALVHTVRIITHEYCLVVLVIVP